MKKPSGMMKRNLNHQRCLRFLFTVISMMMMVQWERICSTQVTHTLSGEYKRDSSRLETRHSQLQLGWKQQIINALVGYKELFPISFSNQWKTLVRGEMMAESINLFFFNLMFFASLPVKRKNSFVDEGTTRINYSSFSQLFTTSPCSFKRITSRNLAEK